MQSAATNTHAVCVCACVCACICVCVCVCVSRRRLRLPPPSAAAAPVCCCRRRLLLLLLPTATARRHCSLGVLTVCAPQASGKAHVDDCSIVVVSMSMHAAVASGRVNVTGP